MLLITLLIAGLAVWLYQKAILRFQHTFVAEYEEAQRQARRPNSSEGLSAMGTVQESLITPQDVDAEYADVLAQLEQRRKEQRRPKPR